MEAFEKFFVLEGKRSFGSRWVETVSSWMEKAGPNRLDTPEF